MSVASIPSTNSCAPETKEKTILATSSALLELAVRDSSWREPPAVLASLPVYPSPLREVLPRDRSSAEVGSASRPVLRIMEPSVFESMRVDCTPGLLASLDRFSRVDAGFCMP